MGQRVKKERIPELKKVPWSPCKIGVQFLSERLPSVFSWKIVSFTEQCSCGGDHLVRQARQSCKKLPLCGIRVLLLDGNSEHIRRA